MATSPIPFELGLSTSTTSAATGGTIGDSIQYGFGDRFGLIKMLALIGGAALIVWLWRRK